MQANSISSRLPLNNNNNKEAQDEAVKARAQLIGWLGTFAVSSLTDLSSKNFSFSEFNKRNVTILMMSAVAGFFCRDVIPLAIPGIIAPLVSIWNVWNAMISNECNYMTNSFALGVFVREYASKGVFNKFIPQFNKPPAPPLPAPPREFKTIHFLLQEKLDQKVVGQTQANGLLAKAIASHYEKLLNSGSNMSKPMASNLEKGNILLLGPSGSGKTLMMQSISEALGLPMAMVDASRLTPEGYIGPKFDDAFRQLYEKSNQNIALAEHGMILIDEVDKLFKVNDQVQNNFSGVQNQLLSYLQGADVKFKTSDSIFAVSKSINTKNILFVMSGAFGELFSDQNKKGETSVHKSSLEIQDLINYGFKTEFVGRLAHLIQLKHLSRDDYRAILLNQESTISIPAWQKEFEKNGLILDVDESLIDNIIDHALDFGTGARGLDFALRQLINPIFIESIEKKRSGSIPQGTIVHVTPEDWINTGLAQQRQKENTFPTLGELKSVLEEHVVGQQDAKNTVAEAIYFHFCNKIDQQGNQFSLPKSNVLLVGPSGTGKTLIMETISKKLGLPMAILDASRLTREGIVGPKSSDAIVSLLRQTKGNVRKAEKGIIFLDEIDKVFQDAQNLRLTEVAGMPIQNQLLSMLQGDDITVTYNNEKKTVSTKNILFVMAGAFTKLTSTNKKITIDDQMLLNAGVIPEFLGRIGYISQLYPLTPAEIKRTLSHGPSAPLKAWTNIFEQHGAKLTLTDKTLSHLVEMARRKTTGIRGIHFELRKLLSSYLAKAIDQGSSGPISSKPVLVVV